MNLRHPLLLCLPLCAPSSGQDAVRITEWMYKGSFAEFFELTNIGTLPVDLSGWSMDDQTAVPGTLDLSPLGTLGVGESALVTDTNEVLFAAEWGLSGIKILGGNVVALLGRNDEINIFDAAGALHDSLTYGDEDFPGTVKTEFVSANGCAEALGRNYIWSWEPSQLGDAHGSYASSSGDLGNPGSYLDGSCGLYSYCGPSVPNSSGLSARMNATGSRLVSDNDLTVSAWQLPIEQFGYLLVSQTQGLITSPPGSQGDLCLSGQIGRFVDQIQSSGPGGSFSITVDLTAMPMSPPVAIQPGETWNFSVWFRDNNPTPTSNFADAVAIRFE